MPTPSNTIPLRIADYIKDYPPFNLLSKADVQHIANHIVVQYYTAGQPILVQGQPPNPFIYLIREGSVDLVLQDTQRENLIDRCGEGEVFGLRALLAGDNYALSANAVEECLIYAVPTTIFQPFYQNNAQVAYYLASSFAAGVRSLQGTSRRGRIFIRNAGDAEDQPDLSEVQQLPFKDNPLTCLPATRIQEAAIDMAKRRVGSIIVTDENGLPKGIVTYKDLARQTASGKIGIDAPVNDIMSAPVITIGQGRTLAEAQILMLRHNIHHLVTTVDGTVNTAVQGVISHHDLLVLQGNSPAVIIREMQRSQSTDQLRHLRERAEQLLDKYLHQEVSIAYIAEIMSQVNDTLIQRCMEMVLEGREAPPVGFCWLSLGSEGRKEQLLRTDQDNALVFEDVPEEDFDKTQAYFLDLAGAMNDQLNACGFEYCPADMMARNPKWCLSLQAWKNQFSDWIFSPGNQEILHANIFFDYRPVYGNAELAASLTQHIYECLEGRQMFLNIMAQHAVQSPPPLSFFRNFILEDNGEHKDEFDIKKRAMMALTDAARILTLEARIHGINSTIERFEKLAELQEQHRELFQLAADAYEVLMRIRALQGLQNKDSGRFIRPSDLTEMQRILLRNSFPPVKKLQESLRLRFQLNYFS